MLYDIISTFLKKGSIFFLLIMHKNSLDVQVSGLTKCKKNFLCYLLRKTKHTVPCHSIIPLLLHATEKTSQNHLYKTVKIKVLMSSFYYLLFFYAFVFIVYIYVCMCTCTNMYIVAMDLVLICPHLSLLSSISICWK